MLEIPAETITQEAGGSRITFPLSAAQVVGKPFRIRARTPFHTPNAAFHSPFSTLHSPHFSFRIPHCLNVLSLQTFLS